MLPGSSLPAREPGDRPGDRSHQAPHSGIAVGDASGSRHRSPSSSLPRSRCHHRKRTAGVLCGEKPMHRNTLSGAVAALILAFSLPAQADEGTPLGDVTVTATRTPLIADQEVAPVIVIGPEQLQLAQGQDVGAV